MERGGIENQIHIGKAIESIRKLRGITQISLANQLGISKQAISKLEQCEVIYDERLKQIADALGVTMKGLKAFSEDAILSLKKDVTQDSIPKRFMPGNSSFEKIIELYECLVKCEQEKVQILLATKQ